MSLHHPAWQDARVPPEILRAVDSSPPIASEVEGQSEGSGHTAAAHVLAEAQIDCLRFQGYLVGDRPQVAPAGTLELLSILDLAGREFERAESEHAAEIERIRAGAAQGRARLLEEARQEAAAMRAATRAVTHRDSDG